GSCQMKGFLSLIYKPDASGKNSFFRKNRIKKFRRQSGYRVFYGYNQCPGLIIGLSIGGRKSFQSGFARKNSVCLILKITDPAAIFLYYFYGRRSEIRCAENGIFLFDVLQRKFFICIKNTGSH